MTRFTCEGCGTVLPDPRPGVYPFRCPNAGAGDDVDHVVRRAIDQSGLAFPDGGDPNPFVRYRQFLSAYALALDAGMTLVDMVAWMASRTLQAVIEQSHDDLGSDVAGIVARLRG